MNCPTGMELPDRAEDRPLRSKGTAERRFFTNESHQAPARPRIFYENPLSSVAFSATPPFSKGRGLWHYVMQHWRHKSKSRNADYILIAAKGGDTKTLGPKARQT